MDVILALVIVAAIFVAATLLSTWILAWKEVNLARANRGSTIVTEVKVNDQSVWARPEPNGGNDG